MEGARGADAAAEDGAEDTVMQKLMTETFGPSKEAEQESDRVQRGLDKMSELEREAPNLRWLYESPLPRTERQARPLQCLYCHTAKPAVACARCKVAPYCDKTCQTADWRAGHKRSCARYQLLGRAMRVPDADAHRMLMTELLRSVRMHLSPFAIAAELSAAETRPAPDGRRFVFVQSESTLAELSLPTARDTCGAELSVRRTVLLQHVTLPEFEKLTQEESGLRLLTPTLGPLESAFGARRAGAKPDDALVLLCFADGYHALASVPLVPDRRVCLVPARDYMGKEALNLHLDDEDQ